MFGEKVYLVQAHFSSYHGSDVYYVIPIGLFIDQKTACDIAHKWESFFSKTKQKISEIPYSQNNEDALSAISERFPEVDDFSEITVNEFELNVDMYPTSDKITDQSRTEEYSSMVKQWDRDYKISKII